MNFPSSSWNIEAVINALEQTQQQIDIIQKVVCHGNIPNKENMYVFWTNTKKALRWWIECTWVGKEKCEQIKTAFQNFYLSLYQLLITFKESDKDVLRTFANEALYQGVVYRYLGYGEPCDSMVTSKKIIYNDIYVSWSKNSNVPWIKNKLYGKITKITCKISGEYYGIDIMAFFETPINKENEIVFPTIEKLIFETEVI